MSFPAWSRPKRVWLPILLSDQIVKDKQTQDTDIGEYKLERHIVRHFVDWHRQCIVKLSKYRAFTVQCNVSSSNVRNGPQKVDACGYHNYEICETCPYVTTTIATFLAHCHRSEQSQIVSNIRCQRAEQDNWKKNTKLSKKWLARVLLRFLVCLPELGALAVRCRLWVTLLVCCCVLAWLMRNDFSFCCPVWGDIFVCCCSELLQDMSNLWSVGISIYAITNFIQFSVVIPQ